MPRPLTKKDLEKLVAELEEKLTVETGQRGGLTTELTTAQETIERLEAQAAEAAAALAAAQAVAATQAAAVAAQPPAAPPVVPKPRGAIRGLEVLSGLSHLDYKAVQRCVRNLVVMANLDVTEDFRRQNAEHLAKLYRAAREDHPILRRFQNNWVTAELAKQFLQNRRKHGVRMGYIDRTTLKTSAPGHRRVRRFPSVEI